MKKELLKTHYVGLLSGDLVSFSDDLISCKISSDRCLVVKIEIYDDPSSEDLSNSNS